MASVTLNVLEWEAAPTQTVGAFTFTFISTNLAAANKDDIRVTLSDGAGTLGTYFATLIAGELAYAVEDTIPSGNVKLFMESRSYIDPNFETSLVTMGGKAYIDSGFVTLLADARTYPNFGMNVYTSTLETDGGMAATQENELLRFFAFSYLPSEIIDGPYGPQRHNYYTLRYSVEMGEAAPGTPVVVVFCNT